MRIFYKTNDNKLNEFYGKHRNDIESIISGIIDDAGNNFKSIIMFDGTNIGETTYSSQLTFYIRDMEVVSEKEERVTVTHSQLDWLVKTHNT